MPVVEAVLMYQPGGLGQEGGIPLGATGDVQLLQAVGEQLLDEARRAAEMWQDVDPGLAGIKWAELERLRQVLELVLPGGDPDSDLELVE